MSNPLNEVCALRTYAYFSACLSIVVLIRKRKIITVFGLNRYFPLIKLMIRSIVWFIPLTVNVPQSSLVLKIFQRSYNFTCGQNTYSEKSCFFRKKILICLAKCQRLCDWLKVFSCEVSLGKILN